MQFLGIVLDFTGGFSPQCASPVIPTLGYIWVHNMIDQLLNRPVKQLVNQYTLHHVCMHECIIWIILAELPT